MQQIQRSIKSAPTLTTVKLTFYSASIVPRCPYIISIYIIHELVSLL